VRIRRTSTSMRLHVQQLSSVPNLH
jgi:hypothetical protein